MHSKYPTSIAYRAGERKFFYITIPPKSKQLSEKISCIVNGNIHIGDSNYDIRPAKTEVTPRNVQEIPGRFGRRYILEDQTHISRERSNMEHDIMAPFRHFDGQHKQNHFSHSDAMLSSTNETTKSNRLAKGENRYGM
ncbi:hypothetical protein CHS0354_002812 [Potamilus streckersoni]|uniref:Uncharacterized protein n=1 Tax=Potamilus streckersoni TaxID=2493646 RepID=A0AAE0VGN9_9BIVA|nr:hypothetical protein CHS0354_002812 [Potamilus streckersoni]